MIEDAQSEKTAAEVGLEFKSLSPAAYLRLCFLLLLFFFFLIE